MWCDTDPYDWLNDFNNFYVAAIVDMIVGVALELIKAVLVVNLIRQS